MSRWRITALAGLWFACGVLWAPLLLPAAEPIPVAPPAAVVAAPSSPGQPPGLPVPARAKATRSLPTGAAAGAAAPAVPAEATVPDAEHLARCLAGRTIADGKLLLRLVLGAEGRVRKVSSVAGDFLTAADERCLERALRDWRWPVTPGAPAAEVVLTVVL